ncbi:MAG TPA: ABC transporter substrate-binding protein [Ktedonobacterales bacterium]|nr:ABC transporter substrate-binding protein [Ktedonobacterales bacterium]
MELPRKMRFWRTLGMASMLSLVVLLAACGSSGGNTGTGSGGKGPTNALNACPTKTNTTAASPVSGKIHLTVAGWSSSPAEDSLVQQALNQFMQQNPDISITWQIIPGDYPTKMRADVATGNVPDVFYLQPGMAQEYIKGGKLLNLSPYMARDNVPASDFYGSLMQPFDCADGTVYGIAKDWNSLGLFYNKTMFQQAGLGDPSNWSWTDLQNAAQKLSHGKTYGIALPADASRWGAFLFANGGQMLSNNGQQATFNSQQGITAANFYTSFQLGKTGVQPGDVGAGWDGDAFGKQEVAMTFEGGWMIPFMAQSFPNVQYGIAPVPMAPDGKRGNLLYTNAWAAYSGTKYPDAAWKLIQFLTGAGHQGDVLRDGFALPTIKSLANDPYFQQNPGVAVLQQGANYGTADFYGAADSEVHTEVANALTAIMLGKSSVQDALNTAAQNVNTWIQQNEAP